MILRYIFWTVAFIFAVNLFHILRGGGSNFPEGHQLDQAVSELDASTPPLPQPVKEWLRDQQLEPHLDAFRSGLVHSLVQLGHLPNLPELPDADAQLRLETASRRLRGQLALQQWLDKNGWAALKPEFDRHDICSLHDLSRADISSLPREAGDAQKYLPPPDSLNSLEDLAFQQLQEAEARLLQTTKDPGRSNWLVLLLTVVVGWLVWELGLTPFNLICCLPLHKCLTRVEWPDDMAASNTKTFTVHFYNIKGQPLDVSQHLSQLRPNVHHNNQEVTSFVSRGSDSNKVQVVFTSRLAGPYHITLVETSQEPSIRGLPDYPIREYPIRGFPIYADILPGEATASTTQLHGCKSSTLVLTAGLPDTIQIDPRDAFGNLLPRDRLSALSDRFKMRLLKKLCHDDVPLQDNANFVVYHTPIMDNLCASMAFAAGQEGWYKAVVTLDDKPLAASNATLTLIVLSRQERSVVDKYVGGMCRRGESSSSVSCDAELVVHNATALSKPKSVFWHLTSKQITIKDYLLRFIPRRLYTFRLIPSTKITLIGYTGPSRVPVVRLEDGFQGKPCLRTKEGNILAACFHLLLLHKMGGSESFNDKQIFFFSKLLKHHQSKNNKHTTLWLRVQRSDILVSSYSVTRWFGESDWCRLFEIEFAGEPGIDEGGLRREWFEVLCKKLFHPDTGLFISLEDNSEAVYPNPNASKSSSKLYRFAGKIVGKSLYESAHGSTYRLLLPARLAKSFLAQLVGLRVHYCHFADDAPELYASKIKFIEEHPVQDLELTFTDEEYGRDGQPARVVDLVDNGSRRAVTDDNKLEYLDRLAQHRLCSRIKEPLEQFLAGLHQFVPDSLLSLFDENELELLLCGVREYSLDDLRANHVVVSSGDFGGGGSGTSTLDWFWLALSSFSAEQFARMVQFCTGSSQLPPGGFADLKPLFQIAACGPAGNLPMAHTCFNMICLPQHESFQEFEQALLTAINEGCEGFGLA